MSLEGWLAARRTVKAMGLVVEHSKMTTVAVELLSRCIQNAIEERTDQVQSNFSMLEQKEHEADDLRRRIIEELARGELPSDERVGLMRLGRQLDWITDWAHEAARILILFNLSQIPPEIRQVIVKMCDTVRQCTVKVTDSVEKLMDGATEESLRAADGVERLEEQVDGLHQEARSKITEIDGVKVGAIILLSQFLEAVENTADHCEDSCDQVRVMAVTLSKRKD